MLHLRVIAPPDQAEEVAAFLEASPAVAHLWVARGAARKPPGDVIVCDVAREGATALVDALKERGLAADGAIQASAVEFTVSDAAVDAEKAAPGGPVDAVVWQKLEENAGEETELSWTYVVFMVVASLIASVGVLLDQPILIVGAMVVGPEFGPLVGLSVGIVSREPRRIRAALGMLALGFAVGIVATILFTWLMTWLGAFEPAMLTAPRPNTSFIWKPDAISWVIGALAGVAGTLSLTSTKSGALVGVLISVTTVPAAANAAVAFAYWVPDEAIGSLAQLAINLLAITVAGAVTLQIQRSRQERLGRSVIPAMPPRSRRR